MTKEELAAKLNGREYTNEITKQEESQAKDSRLVVIFGASDDLCELRGAIYDELGAYKEAMLFIAIDGTLLPEIEDDDMDVLKKYGALVAIQRMHDQATKVRAYWCATEEYSWTYETKAPHSTFDVMDGKEKYCRGIILDLNEL